VADLPGRVRIGPRRTWRNSTTQVVNSTYNIDIDIIMQAPSSSARKIAPLLLRFSISFGHLDRSKNRDRELRPIAEPRVRGSRR
jgi:hypothetical protein